MRFGQGPDASSASVLAARYLKEGEAPRTRVSDQEVGPVRGRNVAPSLSGDSGAGSSRCPLLREAWSDGPSRHDAGGTSRGVVPVGRRQPDRRRRARIFGERGSERGDKRPRTSPHPCRTRSRSPDPASGSWASSHGQRNIRRQGHSDVQRTVGCIAHGPAGERARPDERATQGCSR